MPQQIPSRIPACRFLPLRVIPISALRDSRERKQGTYIPVTDTGSDDACGPGAKTGLPRHLWMCACSPCPACTLGSEASLPWVPRPSLVLHSFPFPAKQLQSLGQICTEKTLRGLKRLPPCSQKRSEVVLISSPTPWHLRPWRLRSAFEPSEDLESS